MDTLPPGYSRLDVPVPDGRTLEVLLSGPDGGGALVFHPGTPMGAIPVPDFDSVAHSHGLRVLSISRPGYGLSPEAPGRSVADVAADVAAVLDELGIERFVTAGVSGGGPHTLACGALLAGRCAAVADISGVGPFDAEGLDWYDGMAQENIDEFGVAEKGRDEIEALLDELRPAMLAMSSGDEIVDALAGLLCAADQAFLRQGGVAEFLIEGGRRALLSGTAGWRDDDLAFVRPWGFDVADVSVPVSVWHGAEDTMVPVAHARWIAARAPAARTEILEGEGHLSILPIIADRLTAELAAALES